MIADAGGQVDRNIPIAAVPVVMMSVRNVEAVHAVHSKELLLGGAMIEARTVPTHRANLACANRG
jgi:hypothetical protein